MSVEEDAKRLARLVKEGGVTIFSGAGLSTESGLQDFRSTGYGLTPIRPGWLRSARWRIIMRNSLSFTRRASMCRRRSSLISATK